MELFGQDLPPTPNLNLADENDPVNPRTESAIPSSPSQASYFQNVDSTLLSQSDSDTEPDLGAINDTWAGLMNDLNNMKISAVESKGKGKGKKWKGNSVVLETSEMRRIMEKISKAEKEYMFNRKEAGVWLYFCRGISPADRS